MTTNLPPEGMTLRTRLFAREFIPFDEVSVLEGRRARLVEFFDEECVTDLPDGAARVEAFLPVDEWVISFLMGLPGAVSIDEPESLRKAILERAQALAGANSRTTSGA